MQAPKNHYSDEYVVQVELKTHNANDDTQNAERTSTKDQQPYSIATGRDKRTIKPPTKYGFEDLVSYTLITSSGDPTNFQETILSQEKGSWMGAMEEEMQSLHKNQMWELVELPKGKRAIRCKWVYKKKEVVLEKEGEKFKASLVAKGYSQKHGVDYDEIFSPVVKHTSIKTMLSLVAYFDMELEQMVLKTTFHHGELEETVYMVQPEGFTQHGQEHLVCKLKKNHYMG